MIAWQFFRGLTGVLIGLALLCLLSGCVTEMTGTTMPPPSAKEAADLNLQLGIGYLRRGDLQTAQAKLEKSAEQNPDVAMTHSMLGLVYARMGDAGVAEKAYRRAVSVAPKDPDALNTLAVFLCRNDKGRPEAMDLLDRALAVPLSAQFSNKAMLNTNAGMCVKPADLPRAEDYLRTALQMDPRFSLALVQLADVAYQRGNYLQSRAFLQRYLSQDEVSPSVLWLGVQIESAMGDVRAADDYGRRLKRDFPGSVEARMFMERERDAGT